MAKLVKLTDEIGAILQERADKDNVSLAGEIKLLLDGKDDNNINQRLDRLGAYLEKKFAELKKSIEDTTIDRLESHRGGGRGGFAPSTRVSLDWPLVQELIFDVAEPEDFVSKSLYTGAHESNILEEIDWFIEDGQVWGDLHGNKLAYLNLTPNVSSFLTSKGVVWE